MRDILSVPQSLPKAAVAHRFDPTSLQLILNVAEAASITHGARRSHLSLAAASERIRALEASVGAALFDRKRRGVELTPAGSVVVQYASIAMQQLEQMRGELARYAMGLRVRIRLLSNTVGLLEYLPRVLARYLAAFPQVDVDLDERPTRDIVQSITLGRADIGIIGGPLGAEGSELETFPLAENRLVLIVPRGHPLARLHCASLATALDYDWVGLGTTSVLQSYVEQQARLVGRRPKLRVRLGTFDTIGEMVASGVGVAVVPEVAARRWARSSRVKIIALSDAWAIRHLTVCTRRARLLSTEARKLLEYLTTSKVGRPSTKRSIAR
jgi:DNA-binding transcriptional LysR family regulator